MLILDRETWRFYFLKDGERVYVRTVWEETCN